MMNTFKKEERLCSKKIIEDLFRGGRSFVIEPLRVVWLEQKLSCESPAQILISVPLHKFKRAVDRNKIKRLLKEAYRKNKNLLYQFLNENHKQCVFSLFYISNEIVSYSEIESKIILILQRLIQKIKGTT